nr:hypothetical protein [Nocardia pseudovaccinii]
MMFLAPGGEIDRGVEITIEAVTAVAGEDPIRQRQYAIASSATRTHATGRKPAIREQYLSAAPLLFIAHQAGELTPSGIADGTGKMPIGQHSGGIEVFQDQPVVGIDQAGGDLV